MVMISAIPALSSAPRRVEPSAVMRVRPLILSSTGKSAARITRPSRGRKMSPPS